MERFYTSVHVKWNDILEQGYDENGDRFRRKVSYNPYLFINGTDQLGYKTIFNEPVKKIDFHTIQDAREFLKKYENVSNFPIYGMTQYAYPYILETYPGIIKYDKNLITVLNIDIETDSSSGFPEPEEAIKEIIAISLRCRDIIVVLGCQPYTPKADNVHYILCKDEKELILQFISYWQSFDPDVVTGWNVGRYDITYIINRIIRLFGEKTANRLSPWGIIEKRTVQFKFNNKTEETIYSIPGVSILDYLDLYKKFTFKKRESYKLDHIGHVELKVKKLDYSEYDNLNQLFIQNYEKFIDYNIHDTEIVDRLDKKLHLIDLAYMTAYDCKVNLQDVFGSVRKWDVDSHNYLMKNKIVVPFKKFEEKTRRNIGGFVREIMTGLYKWIVSFDVTSLYPMLMVQNNIGPDTIFEALSFNIDQIFNGALDDPKIREWIIKNNVTVCGSGQCFTRAKPAFLSMLVEDKFNRRSKYKKLMITTKIQFEKELNNTELEQLVAQYDGFQNSMKIGINDVYGATSNEYFRWYDIRLAEAITLSGQLAVRWIIRDVNKYLNKLLGTEDEDFIIAADTDSCYIHLDKVVHKFLKVQGDDAIVEALDQFCKKRLGKIIDESFKRLYEYTNGIKPMLNMKRECIAKSGIWIAKKHYVLNVFDTEGVRHKEPEVKTVGIESNKSSTPEACRDIIKEAVKIILNKSEGELIDYIAAEKEKYYKLPIEDIAMPRGITEIGKYIDLDHIYGKHCPIHVKGAIHYNNMLDKMNLVGKYPKIVDNDHMKFVHLLEPNPVHDAVIGFQTRFPPDFGLDEYIDRKTMFEKAVLVPLKSMTDLIGWSPELRSNLNGAFE